jgi:hypothetical protein
MSKLLQKLWADDCGALIASEFLFVATILVLGLVAGLVSMRNAVNAELAELGNAVLALNQSYYFNGQLGCCGFTPGSAAFDVYTPVTEIVCTPTVAAPINQIPSF